MGEKSQNFRYSKKNILKIDPVIKIKGNVFWGSFTQTRSLKKLTLKIEIGAYFLDFPPSHFKLCTPGEVPTIFFSSNYP